VEGAQTAAYRARRESPRRAPVAGELGGGRDDGPARLSGSDPIAPRAALATLTGTARRSERGRPPVLHIAGCQYRPRYSWPTRLSSSPSRV